MRNRRRYWELKKEAENRKGSSIEHKEQKHIFHRYIELLINSIIILVELVMVLKPRDFGVILAFLEECVSLSIVNVEPYLILFPSQRRNPIE